MKLVILESPYAGDVELNVRYARACTLDCLNRGEAPMVSHLLYTQEGVLDDLVADERTLGIEAGLAWGPAAEKTVVYTDLGTSPGMKGGIERANAQGRLVEFRTLPGWVDEVKKAHTAQESDGFWRENGLFVCVGGYAAFLAIMALLQHFFGGK